MNKGQISWQVIWAVRFFFREGQLELMWKLSLISFWQKLNQAHLKNCFNIQSNLCIFTYFLQFWGLFYMVLLYVMQEWAICVHQLMLDYILHYCHYFWQWWPRFWRRKWKHSNCWPGNPGTWNPKILKWFKFEEHPSSLEDHKELSLYQFPSLPFLLQQAGSFAHLFIY